MLPIVERYHELKRAARRHGLRRPDGPRRPHRQHGAAVGVPSAARFRAVLLDEFQDTSEAQLPLLHSLFARPRRRPSPPSATRTSRSTAGAARAPTTLTASRDDFADDRGPPRVLPLSTSWRNDRAVLDAANAIAAPLATDPRAGRAAGPARCRPWPGRGRPGSRRPRTRPTTSPAGSRPAGSRRPAAHQHSAAVLCRQAVSSSPWCVEALRRHGHAGRGRGSRRAAPHPGGQRPRRRALGGAGPDPRRPADAPAHRDRRAAWARPTSTACGRGRASCTVGRGASGRRPRRRPSCPSTCPRVATPLGRRSPRHPRPTAIPRSRSRSPPTDTGRPTTDAAPTWPPTAPTPPPSSTRSTTFPDRGG